VTIEETPKLDIRHLRRAGVLRDGLSIELRWSYCNRETVSHITMKLDSVAMVGSMIANKQGFQLRGFRLKSGGCGWWLVCPACGALRFVLMFNDCNGRVLGCRGCLGLRYRAQNVRGCIGEYEEAAGRAQAKSDRLRAQGHERRAERWYWRAVELKRQDDRKFYGDALRFLARRKTK